MISHTARIEADRAFRSTRVLATPAAIAEIPPNEILAALNRHERGDCGEFDTDDLAENDPPLREGTRLLSAYVSSSDSTAGPACS